MSSSSSKNTRLIVAYVCKNKLTDITVLLLSVAVPWNTSINGFTVPLPFTFNSPHRRYI